MKRVLIVSYYWPPGGGGGVMRWLKMSKYLSKNSDWNPLVFTPKNAGYLIKDSSLEKEVPEEIEVIRLPILEPNNFLGSIGLSGLKNKVASGGISGGSKKQNLKDRMIVWVRSNLFIPDPRFMWIKPAADRIIDLVNEKKISAIITTGPPHSMHLIGLHVKKRCQVKWIADFRDPWTFIDFFEDLKLTNWARKKHFRLEKKVIESADRLVTVSKSWGEEFFQLYGRKFEIITNGYDPEDFTSNSSNTTSDFFEITHIGSLSKDRNHPVFWQVLANICQSNSAFKEKLKVSLIGTITPELSSEIKELGLSDNVILIDHMPHGEVIKKIEASTLLLLLINNTSNQMGIIPGKLYEYLAATRPILCIGTKEGDTAAIIQETQSGEVIDFNDTATLEKVLLAYFSEYITNNNIEYKGVNIEKYSRKELALKYAELLNSL